MNELGTQPFHVALAWIFVGIPLAWGVLQTLSNALLLFK
jgi:hypothetical protein